MEEKANKAAQLLEYWEEYLSISAETATQTMEAEVQLFLRRVTKLELLLKELYMKCSSAEEGQTILQLIQNCTNICESVAQDKSLSAGGRFEWVDSVLVKCLQEGSWLLVDNVNLCSAAVLDRLNALLEPNGVLTISERGVDENGKMFEVKPHKDFRIFLTMDPKNGEISRAMRNRGVEIYMLNETETTQSNQFDLKSMIDLKGLNNPKHITALLQIHELISSLILSEKPGNLEILQCASLIGQQLRHGIDVTEAFSSTCIEIYYKTRNLSEFNCDNVLEVIKEEIKHCLTKSTATVLDYYNSDMTLNTKNLDRWSSLEKVKHQLAIYKTVFNKFKENAKKGAEELKAVDIKRRDFKDATIWSDLQRLELQHQFLEKIDLYPVFYLCTINYTLSSKDDLDYRHCYIKTLMTEDEWKKSMNVLWRFMKDYKNMSSLLPADTNWIDDAHSDGQHTKIHYAMQGSWQKDLTEISHATVNSALDYAHNNTPKVIKNIFPNPIFANYRFIRNIFLEQLEVFREQFPCGPDADGVLIKVMELLSWRQALNVYLSIIPLPDAGLEARKLFENRLEPLTLYYKWFYKYSVKGLQELLGQEMARLEFFLAKNVTPHIVDLFSTPTTKFAKTFRKVGNIPNFFKSKWQLTALDLLRTYDLFDSKNDPKRILAFFKANREYRTLLVKLMQAVYASAELNDELALLKPFEDTESQYMTIQEMEVLPIIDHLTQKLLWQMFHAIKSSKDFSLDSINGNFLIPVEFNGILLRYKETGDKKLLHEIQRHFYSMATNSASARPNKFINGRDDTGISLSVAEIEPVLLNWITKLLVGSNGGGECTTLNNFRQLQDQRRFLALALWDNMHALSDEKADFISVQEKNLLKSSNDFLSRVVDARDARGSDVKDLDSNLTRFVLANRTFIQKKIHEYKNLSIADIGIFHAILGFSELYFNSMLPKVDPLAKRAMKKIHISSQINMFKQMKSSFDMQNSLFNNEEKSRHPLCKAITEEIASLEMRLKKYGETVNIGVECHAYRLVVQQINHALNVININFLDDLEKCTKTIETLNLDTYTNTIGNEIESSMKRLESAIPSIEQILQDWKQYRTSYPDIVEPLLTNLSQFLYGCKLGLFWNKRVLMKFQHSRRFKIDLEHELLQLVTLPSISKNNPSLDFCVDCYIGQKDSIATNILLGADESRIKEQEHIRLIKCGLQEYFNQCITEARNTKEISPILLGKFNTLTEMFVDTWNQQQMKLEKEKSEAESLYKIRTKCDDKSEEEQIDDELKELFPNHHVLDFSDLQPKSLCDSTKETPPIKVDETSCYFINEEELRFVIDLHSKLFINFIKTEWLNPEINKNVQPDFVNPLMEKYKVVRRIMDNHEPYFFYYGLDAKLFGSLTVLIEVSRRYGAANELVAEGSPKIITKKTKDFYKDSDVEEVKTCYHVLEQLKQKVEELLLEWPDQPTLNTILTIIDRILDFDIKSPISRFLTGFDILLVKCHEWEQVAHSGVSLINNTPELVAQIIAWRKLELSRWKELLNTTFAEMTKSLSKWWLYMYNLSNQYVKQKQVSEVDLIDTIQRFMTKSSIVEFHGRLDILLEFHCYAVMLPKSPESDSFINILWNVYNYFNQFSASVANKIKDLRGPIERKLKDYVKIVKWKDVSYWAVKDTVDKSHKTLHKFVREYRELLSQPVTPFLTNPISDNPTESVGIWDRPQRQNPKAYHYTLDADSYIIKTAFKDSKYLSKARKICKETILKTDYPNLVQSLDGFVTDVIETSTHLRKLEVDTTLSKEKQKSQAKNILHQKHRALADLFQNLSKIGVSYKTGLVDTKVKNLSDDYTIPPINLSAGFSNLNINHMDQKLLIIWDSCELYYYRCLMRYDVLHSALLTPAQDLGMQNIDRCKGFVAHLLTFCQKQKKDIINATRSLCLLRGYAKQIRETCENPTYIKTSTLSQIKNTLNSLTVATSQIQLILNSCPEDLTIDTKLMEIPLIDPNSTNLKRKEDENWHKASKLINIITSLTSKIFNNINKYYGTSVAYVPFGNVDLIFEDLEKIVDNIQSLKAIFGPIRIAECLDWLIEAIISIVNQDNYEEVPSSLTQDFEELLNHFTKSTLIIFQNLYKKYKDANESRQTTLEAAEAEDTSLQENHLKELITGSLHSDIVALDLQKVVATVEQVVQSLLGGASYASNEMQEAVAQCLPLFEQLLQLAQYFITQEVAAYRTTCKLTSILSNIFIDLATKGFCIPPEISDELDKEGMSKPSDGMGLGEGQGERDVSDKIESEDQLDDAQPAGQEKENTEEDPDCKEEDKGIEMSEDFDSKLQDKKPSGDDDDNEQSNDSDAEEQMGETEKGADQLDQEIWGDDKDDKEEEDGENEQKDEDGRGGERDGEDQLEAQDENKSKEKSKNKEASEDQDADDSEKSKKEINEMNEPEYDDEQTDPYHGNQPEQPEPEPLDLPDDLQLDEGEENDGERPEENPFDIDEMKEQQVPQDKPEESNERETDQQNDDEKEFSSDDEDVTKKDGNDQIESDDGDTKDEEKPGEQEKVDEPKKSQEDDSDEGIDEPVDLEETALDENPSNQENVEAMEVDDASATDNTQATQAENLKSDQPIDETCQEDKPDKEGLGQSQMEESESGHSVQSTATQQAKSSQKEQEMQQKRKERPGESNLKRTLGDVNEPIEKKLKTMDAKETDQPGKDATEEEEMEQADMYQHIKEAEKESSTQVLDAATKEQAEEQTKEITQKENNIDEEDSIDAEGSKTLPEEEVEEMTVDNDTKNEQAIKPEKSTEKSKRKKQHPDGDVMEELKEVEIEGEIAQTMTVPRGGETFHHTQFHLLQQNAAASKLTQEEINEMRSQVEQELSAWKSAPSSLEAEQTWQKISSVTSSLAQDLSEQLRLVLEPTQASHLKGDFRTGRRINMRKVIPYIASQFRKDKIWLRRTKPSKREYQIVLAIDDSSSMADNHSKELAFESVALISKALSLLESGQLAVVSFGETTEVHHKLTEPFTDKTGVQLLQKFQFGQQKTQIGKLVDFVTEMFEQNNVQTAIPNAKLLLIVSDGRGVFSEGKTYVTQAVRRAQLANIFIVFVIIDNPENKNSILDIRSTIFKDGQFLGMSNYMDEFPFSFYLILRDINALPGVLSDALMQWFEMVTSQQ